jgi:hypothetical protein
MLICLGGRGGNGGEGGAQGGSGGTGEGPTLHIETAHTLNFEGASINFPANMISSVAVAQTAQLMNHCPPASRIFQGRQAVREKLHHYFVQDTRKQKIYVLYGLGGAGKTQIALKFIEETFW